MGKTLFANDYSAADTYSTQSTYSTQNNNSAQNNHLNQYMGANYTLADVNSSGLGAIQLKYGIQIDKKMNVEARIGFGINENEDRDNLKLEHFFGGYLSYHLKPGQKYDPYAIVGFTRGKLETDSFSTFDSDLSYGLGINMKLIKQVTFNIEWINYYDKSLDLNAINFGVMWNI
jgi:hypothetical protein